MKLKDIFGITTYWVYGGGSGHYNTSATDKFKLHRAFVGNDVVTQGNLDLRVEPTEQNFKYDTYLKQLVDLGISPIWCTQGKFDFQNTVGKTGKVMPINEEDNPLEQSSWTTIGELCRQVAIRYAADTAQHLDKAKVFQSTDYKNNIPKAGLGLLDAIEIQNEWDFKQAWSGATRTITPEEYAVCFKVCYDAIRTVSSIKIIMGGGISPYISTFDRFLGKLDQLYAAENKPTPNDFYLCFHWYMRNGSQDQGGGTAGETPETVNAYGFGQSLDTLCESRGLLGWYCTETGWATDTSKQSAPILEGFTREQSQGILMIRLALIWGACKYHKGISFWHCRDDYDLPPYAKGGINYKNWSAKPARTICEEFLAKYGDREVSYYRNFEHFNEAIFDNNTEQIFVWTDKKNYVDAVSGKTLTPMPTMVDFTPTEPPTEPPQPTMRNAFITNIAQAPYGNPIKITEGTTFPIGSYAIYVDGEAPVTLELFKDGVSFIAKRTENGKPLAVGGDDNGVLRLKDFPQGTYKLVMNTEIINFTVGTTTPPPTGDSSVNKITMLSNGSLKFDAEDGRTRTIP